MRLGFVLHCFPSPMKSHRQRVGRVQYAAREASPIVREL